MNNIVERLRDIHAGNAVDVAVRLDDLCQEAADEIERLRAWIRRVDSINDSPACFNVEIDHACEMAINTGLRPEQCTYASRVGNGDFS